MILGITPPALATTKINASPKQTLSADECNLLAAEVNQARSFMQVFEAEVIGGLAIALHHAGAAMQRVADVPSEAELPPTLEVSQSETATVVEQIEFLAVQESMLLRGVNEYCGVSE